ncbi:AAA family ATPase (plasmid) [Clavibacter michiganensis]|uniref:AAA family ATPase n=1 Tax=Clavibacter michiganensis TaxID=28447 RepID=UPI003DA0D834
MCTDQYDRPDEGLAVTVSVFEEQSQPPDRGPDVNVTIRNCNSISEATITLRPGTLNIKYGPNGLGKSTIARALTYRAESDDRLANLTPFKHLGATPPIAPTVDGADGIQSVLTFDDAYVSNFVFRKDEVVENSFEIFINTDEYRAGIKEIEEIFESLKETFLEGVELNEAITHFTELRDAFGVTAAGKVSRSSRGSKALSVGGKLETIPKGLEGYSRFIQSDNPAKWITWQAQGKDYLELSDNCPFCSIMSVDKTTAKKVSEQYNSAAVKNMSSLRAAVDKLGIYLNPADLDQLQKLTRLITSMTPEEENFIVRLHGDIDTFLGKLTAARNVSFHALREAGDVKQALNALRIDLALLPSLGSKATQEIVTLINSKIEEVQAQFIEISKRISQQKRMVAKLIANNQGAINDFLRSAGYKYEVRIEAVGDSYRMLLEHQDKSGHLESASEHLSYGERNAFALVLFMYHAKRVQPDLVVLDDPVSSFDKTKKFAILHQLFHGEKSFQDVTCLLLTHDIEPAIDIARTSTEPAVHFLTGRGGVISEVPVTPEDIMTFSEVCMQNIETASDSIIKCIYARRLLEVRGARGMGYELLSNLLHVREVPRLKAQPGDEAPMTEAEVSTGIAEVRELLPGFEYSELLKGLKDPMAIKARFDATDVGYEKVQLFRVFTELSPTALTKDRIFTKFVNETYHIENEYVMQLNPQKFDAVPEYVVAECKHLIDTASTN